MTLLQHTISADEIASFSEDLRDFAPYTVARNAATSVGVRAAARNPEPYREYHDTYSVSLSPVGHVTNQKKSGRCWLFATCNVLRDRLMSDLGTTDFELSQAYLQFWDKLEKANLFLNEMVRLADQPLDSREILEWFSMPAPDGGWWDMAVTLVEKYGVVPKGSMPDSFNACDTADLNDLLARKLRGDALKLRRAIADGSSEEAVDEMVATALSEVYRILCVTLGEPPKTFTLEYVADARKGLGEKPSENASAQDLAAQKAAGACSPAFVRLANQTPQGFLAEHLGVHLHDYVVLGNVPGECRPYEAILEKQYRWALDGVPTRTLNMPIEVLKDAVIAQLKAGHPVWFSCDVLKNMERTDPTGLLDTETLDWNALVGLDLSIGKADGFDTREITCNHAMTFQGVNIGDDGKPTAWRVENTWGDEKCKKGYFIMTDRYFDAYVGQVVVHKDYLPAKVAALWESPDTPVVQSSYWAPVA